MAHSQGFSTLIPLTAAMLVKTEGYITIKHLTYTIYN